MNLDKLFNPKSVAIIGASQKAFTVGFGLSYNLFQGKKYRKIYFVNPFQKQIFKNKTYSSVKDIEDRIDLAVIAVPAAIVGKVSVECVEKKVGSAVIVSAGFSEMGSGGKELENQIKNIFSAANIPLIGPNCLGIIRPSIDLNATFAPLTPKKGDIAFISQSGALIDSVISQTSKELFGFSLIVSYGNEAGVTLPEFLEWAGKDKETKVIVLYIEGLKNGRKFFEIASKVAKKKPIIVLKGGKSKKTLKTVASHTGALSGDNQMYTAMFEQAGIIQVESLEEMFDAAKALSWQPKCRNGLAVITNGGGAGILTADYCEKLGIHLPSLSSETKGALERSGKMHPAWSRSNPIDIVGDALSDRYAIAINAALKQRNIYGLIVIQSAQIMTESKKNAQALIQAKKKYPSKPIISVFMEDNEEVSGFLEKNKIPNYSDPLRAVRSFKELIN
ncbi:MAG: CoA-binding protein [Candidatus Pacebacteria bacterium]|nr:CoA-binding protein [Candidatus Paceibacterota bacterium]